MNTPFVHHYEPGSPGRTLLLLHGTGGNEQSLLPLGRLLAPGAGLLSPRGRVLEGSMPRFFRRLAEGVFDEADLIARSAELAGFVGEAARHYGFDPKGVVAAGFSNGANIGASLLLLHPGVLAGGILFRAMVPLEPARVGGLAGTPVWLGAGRHDPIVPGENTERLAALLRRAGAEVTLDWRDLGHQLSDGEVRAAAAWLARGPA
ncbi:MAG: alpha/beta hydrolase [Gemmatimonadetes bacterium]|nr:alpha/beta hydrolase [Gemmatimonadota bacterium]